jgi:hypothetical protein
METKLTEVARRIQCPSCGAVAYVCVENRGTVHGGISYDNGVDVPGLVKTGSEIECLRCGEETPGSSWGLTPRWDDLVDAITMPGLAAAADVARQARLHWYQTVREAQHRPLVTERNTGSKTAYTVPWGRVEHIAESMGIGVWSWMLPEDARTIRASLLEQIEPDLDRMVKVALADAYEKHNEAKEGA